MNRMRCVLCFIVVFYIVHEALSQQTCLLSFTLVDERSMAPVVRMQMMEVSGKWERSMQQQQGLFRVEGLPEGNYHLLILAPDYEVLEIELTLPAGETKDLGVLKLRPVVWADDVSEVLELSEAERNEEFDVQGVNPFLLARADPLLQAAAFSWSPFRYRPRGYSEEFTDFRIDGFEMRHPWSGRINWNQFSGLNDVFRSHPAPALFDGGGVFSGGLYGSAAAETQQAFARARLRVTTSLANQTYTGRIMATFRSAQLHSGLNYILSLSSRQGASGYFEGTPYESYAAFGGVGWRSGGHSLQLSGWVTPVQRTIVSPVSKEVMDLAGSRYNQNWGLYQGSYRTSRLLRSMRPVMMLVYRGETGRLHFGAGAAFFPGVESRTRIMYSGAPNPDPTYYRYLPGFQLNQGTGSGPDNAAMARLTFEKFPQLDWDQLIRINRSGAGEARYVLGADHIRDVVISGIGFVNYRVSESFQLSFQTEASSFDLRHFAKLTDLLGARWYNDKDYFSETRNDVLGDSEKSVGDPIQYDYEIKGANLRSGFGLTYKRNSWEAFMNLHIEMQQASRQGNMLNERYPLTSATTVSGRDMIGSGFRLFLQRHFSNRHRITLGTVIRNRIPSLQRYWLNPREHDALHPELQNESVRELELGYELRLKEFQGGLKLYAASFANGTDVNYFYLESAYGADYVQEVTSGLNRQHMGVEFWAVRPITNELTVQAVLALGNYQYSDPAKVALYFDASSQGLVGGTEGHLDLGETRISGFMPALGPQQAASLELAYRDPGYWWLAVGMNAGWVNPVRLSYQRRTDSFLMEDEALMPYGSQTEVLQRQEILDPVYLLQFRGGASWRVFRGYLSAFGSVQNVFDQRFLTGGYEQGRMGSASLLYQDRSGGTPSFGNKYWRGYGRTFFLNLSFSI